MDKWYVVSAQLLWQEKKRRQKNSASKQIFFWIEKWLTRFLVSILVRSLIGWLFIRPADFIGIFLSCGGCEVNAYSNLHTRVKYEELDGKVCSHLKKNEVRKKSATDCVFLFFINFFLSWLQKMTVLGLADTYVIGLFFFFAFKGRVWLENN